MFFKHFVVRRICYQLESLDEPLLSDIGITRADIAAVATRVSSRQHGWRRTSPKLRQRA